MNRLVASFEGTADEEVDIRKRKIRSNRLPLILLPALWLAIGAYLALGAVRSLPLRLTIALCTGGAGGLVIEMMLKPGKRGKPERGTRLRKAARATISYRFQITKKGLSIERNSDRMNVEWADVGDIDDTGDDVIIQTRQGLEVIRERAFKTKKSRKQFIAAMHKCRKSA